MLRPDILGLGCKFRLKPAKKMDRDNLVLPDQVTTSPDYKIHQDILDLSLVQR